MFIYVLFSVYNKWSKIALKSQIKFFFIKQLIYVGQKARSLLAPDSSLKNPRLLDISVLPNKNYYQLGSVAGPAIQANGRLEFEDGSPAALCATLNQRPH